MSETNSSCISGAQRRVITIKILAIALFLGSAPLAWYNLVPLTAQLQLPLPTQARYSNLYWYYWAAFASGIIAIVVTPFLKSTVLRTVSALLILPGYIFERTAAAIGAIAPGSETQIYDLIKLCWTERANTADAISAYGGSSAPYIAIGIVFLAASILKPMRVRCSNFFFMFLFAAFATAAYVAYQPYAYNRYVFPAPFNIPAYTARVALLETHYSGKRDSISMHAGIKGKRNIVFILDESVRGDFLTINRPTLDNTPYLAKIAKAGVAYGVATSIANCSSAARLALRSGTRMVDLPDTGDKALHRPTFWQFAKAAGYKTVYLDAFSRGFTFHSFMNLAERKLIDDRRTFKPSPEIDNDVAKALRAVLDAPEMKFVFVAKLGVHFPHDGRNEPPNYAYEPKGIETLPMEYSAAQREVVRYYLRSLRWRVDEFFKTLGDVVSREDTVVLYSSDHGQNMFENGFELQHCNTSNASKGEAAVPLMLFSGDQNIVRALDANVANWRNKASHEAIFPTLLALMGYASSDVHSVYGPSLFDEPDQLPRAFLARDLWGEPKPYD